ncbi:MAG: Coq4 family protein [Hyphomonadaceae bacterium]|nr:Coq4 family protein [Hyphomonadaceae bacterium]
MLKTPLIHPERPRPQFKPFTAMSRMRKLIADKEDTEQVFHIIEALNGKNILHLLESFSKTEKGKARLAERRQLAPRLDDHSWIEALPGDSVGQAYLRFMRREGLTAQGLVEEFEKFSTRRYDDTVQWFGNRLRDTHDLFHVLTGYGRDALGEAALLGFTYGQHKGRGLVFIAYMGSRQIRKAMPREIDIMACYREGIRHGKAAEAIIQEDIIALMHEPLAEARQRLNIARPEAYQRAIEQIRQLGNAQELLAAA